VLTAIAAFLFLPYAPVWSIVIVALSVLAIWSLLNRSRDNSGSSGGMGAGSSGSMGAGSSGTYGTGGRGTL
jgi:uncharacterized membrane protein YgcG